jgi:hypothetical protein
MSCCRQPAPLMRNRTRLPAVCVNCRASIRQLVAVALERLSAQYPQRGTHRQLADVVCPKCRHVNRVPIVWIKR